jgi:hypothetical protein
MRVFANFHYSYEYKFGIFYYIIHNLDYTHQVVTFFINIEHFLECYTILCNSFIEKILPLYINDILYDDIIEFVADIPVNLFIPLVIPLNFEIVCLTKTNPAFELDEKLEYMILNKVSRTYFDFIKTRKQEELEILKLIQIKNMTTGEIYYLDKLGKRHGYRKFSCYF